MTTKFKIQTKILLKPVWHTDVPNIRVSAGNEVVNYNLYDPRWFEFEFNSNQPQETISVEFLNKKDTDTVLDKNLDKAVIVEAVDFFGIQDPKFVWAGIYVPHYPEPWASQQDSLMPELKNHNYLSWNGKWTLTFDVPVFTWIHKIQNLGWIYS
jgi:hypothetical protein